MKRRKFIDSRVFPFFKFVTPLFFITYLLMDLSLGLEKIVPATLFWPLGTGAGSTAVLLILISLIFFIVRTAQKRSGEKLTVLRSKSMLAGNAILAALHPVLALVAVLLFLIHGHLLFVKVYQYSIDLIILSGLGGIVLVGAMTTSGMFLKRKLGDKKRRMFHRIGALFFFAVLILHRVAANI